MRTDSPETSQEKIWPRLIKNGDHCFQLRATNNHNKKKEKKKKSTRTSPSRKKKEAVGATHVFCTQAQPNSTNKQETHCQSIRRTICGTTRAGPSYRHLNQYESNIRQPTVPKNLNAIPHCHQSLFSAQLLRTDNATSKPNTARSHPWIERHTRVEIEPKLC